MPHFFVFKPYGMLSQFTPDHPGQGTLADLGFPFPKNAYPVGRLDADSEGLLLLTDDTALNAQLLHPNSRFPKTYLAQVEGAPDEAAIEKLRAGVDIKINGKIHRTRPATVRRLAVAPELPPREPPIRFRKSVPDCWLEITLTEGKNRQVRRMCAAVGFPVLRLVRVGLGAYRLGAGVLAGLGAGDVREVEFTV